MCKRFEHFLKAIFYLTCSASLLYLLASLIDYYDLFGPEVTPVDMAYLLCGFFTLLFASLLNTTIFHVWKYFRSELKEELTVMDNQKGADPDDQV